MYVDLKNFFVNLNTRDNYQWLKAFYSQDYKVHLLGERFCRKDFLKWTQFCAHACRYIYMYVCVHTYTHIFKILGPVLFERIGLEKDIADRIF
jgi:hypothetical protein